MPPATGAALIVIQPNCNARHVLLPSYTIAMTKPPAQAQQVSGARPQIHQAATATQPALHAQHVHLPKNGAVMILLPARLSAASG